MKIIGTAMLLLLLVGVSVSGAGLIYKWVDKDGTPHFTDDLSRVPPEYRNQIQTEETRDSEKTRTPSQAPASVEKTGEEKRDAHGMNEDYWRDRVRPWKKQLVEARERYEEINGRIDDALEAAKGKFLSKTQYNLRRVDVENLMEEREAFAAKIGEANEMLAKIAKEAEEAKADPAWLQ